MMSKLVFTNGCFDVLHIGHIETLRFASCLGRVVVGLNSDESVKGLKGPDRPINSQAARFAVLSAIKYVDQVIVFNDPTPLELIIQLQPDIIVKGGDYKTKGSIAKPIVGHGLAQIRIAPYISGYSTTETIGKL